MAALAPHLHANALEAAALQLIRLYGDRRASASGARVDEGAAGPSHRLAPTGGGEILPLPAWAAHSPTPVIHKHFDPALPAEWGDLFTRVMCDVIEILGGGVQFHAFATHTHVQLRSNEPAGPSALAVLSEAMPLIGHAAEAGDYTTIDPRRGDPTPVVVMQYDTICDAHRRSVIAHEYFHVHQLSYQGEKAGRHELPMWMMEGTAALFEHMYINEYWKDLDRDGVRAAVVHSHANASTFDSRKEDYSCASMNYYDETCGCLFLAHSCGLFGRIHVLFTQFWEEVYKDASWRITFSTRVHSDCLC